MKLSAAENKIKEQLTAVYNEVEAAAIARLVIENCTGILPGAMPLKKEQIVLEAQQTAITKHVERLLLHEPIQYIMNKTWFYGLELYVNHSVLIPRPETEELVDWIIKDMQAADKDVFSTFPTTADATNELKILDIGTGSGCIALALKNNLPRAEVWGCDVSDEALNIARRNGSALNIRVDFQGVNFLDENQLRSLPSVDVIVSNPPYIPLEEKDKMDLNVVEYEPHNALFVPTDDALLFYKAILHFAKNRLHPNGSIYLENHENRANEVAQLFEAGGYSVIIKKDMQGKERMVKAVRK